MCSRKLLMLLGVVAVILSIAGMPSAIAQESLPTESFLLLLPEDVAVLGSTDVLIPDTLIKKESDTSVLAGWEEAHTMSFSVGSAKTKECVFIDSYSYKYASPQTAQMALETIQMPTSLAQDGASLLSEATLSILLRDKPNAWKVMQGKDSEGLPSYTLILQSGPYVIKIRATVGAGAELFGQRLLNQAVKGIQSGKKRMGVTSSSDKTLLSVNKPDTRPQPNRWASNTRAGDWLYQDVGGERHYLATWGFPYGNSQTYIGPGGYNATCLSTSGCINNWTWWLTQPDSRLGIPKSFLILQWRVGPVRTGSACT